MSRQRRPHETRRATAETRQHLALDRGPVHGLDMVFTDPEKLEHVGDAIWEDISCLAVIGRSLFCTCDETATVERVLVDADGRRADAHANFALGEVFDLPDGPKGEMDIEGIAIDDGWLWLTGSHALKRDDPDEDGIRAMEDTEWDPNRAFLGRMPLLDRGDGVFEPVAEIAPADGGPRRRAAMVPMDDSRKSHLRRMLAKDKLIGDFVPLPSKENGLDIEGLAVRGDTVLLGLRGPVIKGWAILVHMEMKATKSGKLKPRKLDGGARHTLQAIDLNGQGIRDLGWHGDRLLILSGATTDLEALQSVFAIEDYDPAREVSPADALRRVLDLPIRRGADHAEGVTIAEIGGEERLVIAYDSPHTDRTVPDAHLLCADVFAIGSPKAAKARSKAGTSAGASKKGGGNGVRQPRAPRRKRQASPRAPA